MVRTTTRNLDVRLNRTKGDLELTVMLQDNQVVDAWSRGTMYRGFENMLTGRGARDGLVLTPRVCGICGTAHLYAAVKALDEIVAVAIPKNAAIVRNLTLLAENIQSDLRHSVLIFMKDFLNSSYTDQPLYNEALSRYESLRGRSVIEVIRMTKKILELVAILGGQWPNSSFMVPGGIAGTPSFHELTSCRYLVDLFRTWYERQILGCSIERWLEVETERDLQRWVNERESHAASDLGFFIRYAHAIGLHHLGRGGSSFITGGLPDLLAGPSGSHSSPTPALFRPGFLHDDKLQDFNQEEISEYVTFSHFKDYAGGRHPYDGVTAPRAARHEKLKYSFTKAPRYRHLPAETGPLAQLLIGGSPLFNDLIHRQGASAYTRVLSRLARPAHLLPLMQGWLQDIEPNGPYYTPVHQIPDGRGHGLVEAARGTLGHWVEIKDNQIVRYQIIPPTTWNGSPRDQNGHRGPWEEALIGTKVANPENPIELEHIVRSFDPCQVCSVHTVRNKERG